MEREDVTCWFEKRFGQESCNGDGLPHIAIVSKTTLNPQTGTAEGMVAGFIMLHTHEKGEIQLSYASPHAAFTVHGTILDLSFSFLAWMVYVYAMFIGL